MRIFRFTLLQSYFSSIIKNKKKALVLINAGIFFSIFAISSAIISFFIEKKISDKQNELFYLQISSKQSSRFISIFESDFMTLINTVDAELVDSSEKRFWAEQKLGSQINNADDYFGPAIYYNIKMIESMDKFFLNDDFIKGGFHYYDINDPIYLELIDLLKNNWSETEVDDFTNSIKNFGIFYKKLKKLNVNDYSYKLIPSLKDITLEILNHEKDNINYESELRTNYFDSVSLNHSLIIWGEQMIKYFNSEKAFTDVEIQRINKEITKLSSNEKNIIMATFIFQFIIFIIIQIFEINSINFHLKRNK